MLQPEIPFSKTWLSFSIILVLVLLQCFQTQVKNKALLCQVLQKTNKQTKPTKKHGKKYEEHLFTLTRHVCDRKGKAVQLI